MAMPAYVLAYAYTDFLQYGGPLQTGLRALTGHRKGPSGLTCAACPARRCCSSSASTPYVYLLARAAWPTVRCG